MRKSGIWMVALCVAHLSSCAMFDFTQLHVEIDPGDRYSVVSPDSGLSLRFSRAVDRDQTEDLVTVVARSRTVAHTMAWQGTTLRLTPVDPPEAGTVHELQIQGRVRDDRGRAHEVAILHHLFYISDAPRAHLLSSLPANGVLAETDSQIGLQFSAAMDTQSVEAAFRVLPEVDVEFEWNDAGDTLRVRPRTFWDGAQTYEVFIERTALSRAGTGLTGPVQRYFRHDASAVPLELTGHRYEMAAGVPGRTVPVPEGSDPIILSFSARVDHRDVQRVLSIRPRLAMETRQRSATEVSLHPVDDYEADTDYHVRIPAGLEDEGGNVLRDAYRLDFRTPDRRAAIDSVRLIWLDGDVLITEFDRADVHDVEPRDPDYLLHAVVSFDREVERGTTRQFVLDNLRVERVLPEGGMPVVLNQFVWANDGRELTTVWSGLAPSGFADASALYRLSIHDPHGRHEVTLTLSHGAP